MMITVRSLLEQANNRSVPGGGNISLLELADALAAREAGIREVALSPRDLQFNDEGLVHDGRLFKINEDVRLRLYQKLHAPGSYLTDHSLGFQAVALREHAKRGDFGVRPIAVFDEAEELITIARGDEGLVNLAGSAVVLASAQELGREGERLFLEKIEQNLERLEINFVSPLKAVDIRVGDTVRAGVSIIHWRYGFAATQIQAYLLRAVCSNGMVRRECVAGDVTPRTRRLSTKNPAAAHDLQMEQIRRLVRRTWNGLQARLEALRNTTQRPVNAEDLLRRWLARARLSERKLLLRLMAAWREEGAENTRYGVVNAITRVATHNRDLDERNRRALASLAGLLAFEEFHICERCGSILGGPEQGGGHLREPDGDLQ